MVVGESHETSVSSSCLLHPFTDLSLHCLRRGVCEDKDLPCETDEDCHAQVDGKSRPQRSWRKLGSWWLPRCSEKGFCVEPSWCPVEAVGLKKLDLLVDPGRF